MLFIFDVLVYVFFAFVMSYMASMSYKSTPKVVPSKPLDKWLWAYILFFTLISAVRWDVGVDSTSYFRSFAIFNLGASAREGEEQFWTFLVKSVYDLGCHPSVGLGITAFLQVFFIVLALKHNRRVLIYIPFLLFGSRYFLDMSNAVRQMIAASIFFYSCQFIIKKQLWKYVVCILAASCFHKSAIVLIVFYLIPNKWDVSKYRYILLVLLATCLIMGLTPALQSFLSRVQYLTLLLGYNGYEDRVSLMLGGGYSDEKLGFGPMMLSYLIISVYVTWYGPILKKKYGAEYPAFNLWYIFANVYACAFFLVCNVSHIFIRPLMYFELFQMVLASMILMLFITTRYKDSLISIFFYCTVAIGTLWNLYKVQDQSQESARYKVFFLHEEEVKKKIN